MDTTFTIITPSFNQAQFIAACIESVLTQAGDFYIDYIVMDGGSNDASMDIVKHYGKQLADSSEKLERDGLVYYVPGHKDSVVRCKGISMRWTSAKDAGQADAINKGLSSAKGTIFGYLNSDDIYYPYAFAQVAAEFSREAETDVVYGNALLVNAHGDVIEAYPSRDVNRVDLSEQCVLSQPSVFVKMETVRLAGKFNPHIKNSLDYEYWLRLYSMGAVFKFIAPVLSATRIHGDTKTNRNQKQIKIECMALAKHYGGATPLSWRVAFIRDATFWGILSSRGLSVMSKLRDFKMKVLAGLLYPFYSGKVSKEEKRLFPKT